MNPRNFFLITLISAASVFSLKMTAVSMAVSAIPESNLQTIKTGLSQAAGDLVVFPELSLCNAQSGKDQAWVDNAVAELKTICVQKQKHLVFGAIRIANGLTYNSAYIINASGVLVGTYDQIHPLGSGYSPGLKIPAFSLTTSEAVIKIGVQIGNDLYFPEPWQFFAERGIRAYVLVFLSTLTSAEPWKKDMHDDLFLAHAADNTVYAVSASAAGAASAVSTQICDGVGVTLAQHDPASGTGSADADASLLNPNFFMFKRHDEWRNDLYRLVLKTPTATEVPAKRMAPPAPAAYPNPLSAGTRILFSIPRDQRVDVSIYTAGGRLVKTLYSGIKGAGDHALAWDGREPSGAFAPAGTYFVRIQSIEKVSVKKIALVR